MKYRVKIAEELINFSSVDVDAKDEEEARKIAIDRITRDKSGLFVTDVLEKSLSVDSIKCLNNKE